MKSPHELTESPEETATAASNPTESPKPALPTSSFSRLIKTQAFGPDLDFDSYQPQPGHPDWSKLQDLAKRYAHGLQRRLEVPRSLLRDLPRRVSALTTAAENYVVNRQRVSEGREDLLPLYFIWTLLRDCNMQCGYCDDHTGSAYPAQPSQGVSSTEATSILNTMRTRAPAVYFCGGEPTLRRDLGDLVREARDLRYYPIMLNTNARDLMGILSRQNCKDLLANLDIIVVSLDALDVNLLSELWGIPVPEVEKVIQNLLILLQYRDKYNFKLFVNTVIQPGEQNLNEAEAVLDFANDTGITFCGVPQNIAAGIAPGLLDDPQYQELVQKILTRKQAGFPIAGSVDSNQKLLLSQDFQCRNSLKPSINDQGKLLWPCTTEVNIPRHQLSVANFKHYDHLLMRAVQLQDPKGLQSKCGGNCNRAQHYQTDNYHRKLNDPLALIDDIHEFLS